MCGYLLMQGFGNFLDSRI